MKEKQQDFPGYPVVKTSPANAGGEGSISGWGAKIPCASRLKNQKIKQKQYCNKLNQFSSLSCVQLFATPWTAARQASLSITNFPSLLKLMFIKSVMPSHHLILCCHPTISSPSPPALNLSQHHGLFQSVRSLHQVTKVLEFQLQHHSRLIHLGLTNLIFLQFK